VRSFACFRLSARIGRAAALYVAVVFAAGFLLGAARILLVSPRVGELAAVALEAPIMLWVSWRACGLSLRRFRIRGPGQAAAVGGLAFALLMMAELGFGALAFGRSASQFLQAFGTPAGALGLACQVVFGCFPVLSDRLAASG